MTICANVRGNDVLRKIDCLMVRVDDVQAAASYYARVFGLIPQWSGEGAIGLRLSDSDTEVVVHSDPNIPGPVEAQYLVDDVATSVEGFSAQGCQTLVAPFDITIGKCAVIEDPFGVRFCILDMTKGPRPLDLLPDEAGQP
jgi:predicted enzyme related to lactoylglutathione lyase